MASLVPLKFNVYYANEKMQMKCRPTREKKRKSIDEQDWIVNWKLFATFKTSHLNRG
jgi:hypothetical protein